MKLVLIMTVALLAFLAGAVLILFSATVALSWVCGDEGVDPDNCITATPTHARKTQTPYIITATREACTRTPRPTRTPTASPSPEATSTPTATPPPATPPRATETPRGPIFPPQTGNGGFVCR